MAAEIIKYFILLTFTTTMMGVNGIFVSPINFLDAKLNHGTWLTKQEIGILNGTKLFEGGWVWTETGNLITTHICRAKIIPNGDVVPGELLNGTCYVSGKPDLSSPPGSVYGVHAVHDGWSALLKLDDEVYEWVGFNIQDGNQLPTGPIIGGIRGDSFEPLLICRKVINSGTVVVNSGGSGSKAILGNFSPKDGKCYYEVEFGGSDDANDGLKTDLTFTSLQNFQILVLKARGKPACSEPR